MTISAGVREQLSPRWRAKERIVYTEQGISKGIDLHTEGDKQPHSLHMEDIYLGRKGSGGITTKRQSSTPKLLLNPNIWPISSPFERSLTPKSNEGSTPLPKAMEDIQEEDDENILSNRPILHTFMQDNIIHNNNTNIHNTITIRGRWQKAIRRLILINRWARKHINVKKESQIAYGNYIYIYIYRYSDL